MKVSALLEALPGVGKVRARQIMERHRHRRDPPGARAREPTRSPPWSVSSAVGTDHVDGRGYGTGRLVVLSGPSGVGKSTVVRILRVDHPEVWISVSATHAVPPTG